MRWASLRRSIVRLSFSFPFSFLFLFSLDNSSRRSSGFDDEGIPGFFSFGDDFTPQRQPFVRLFIFFIFFSCLQFRRRYMTFLDTRVLFFLCCNPLNRRVESSLRVIIIWSFHQSDRFPRMVMSAGGPWRSPVFHNTFIDPLLTTRLLVYSSHFASLLQLAINL